MNEFDTKNKIEENTDDNLGYKEFLERSTNTPSKQTVVKKRFFTFEKLVMVCCFAIAIIAIIIGTILAKPANNPFFQSYYMTIDVGCSVEIFGEKGVVSSVHGLDEKGTSFAQAISTEIIGQTPEVAIVTILEDAYYLGYYDNVLPNGKFTINFVAKDEIVEKQLVSMILTNAQKFLSKNEIEGSVFINQLGSTNEGIEYAGKYNVTQGKINLMLLALEVDPALNIDNLATMSPNEIYRIIIGK